MLFAGYNIGKNLLEIVLTLLFVTGLGMNWQGRLGSSVLSVIIAGIVSVLIMKKWNLWTADLDKNTVKKKVCVGLPFIPEHMAIFVLAYSAGFFINYYKGINDVGYYIAQVHKLQLLLIFLLLH